MQGTAPRDKFPKEMLASASQTRKSTTWDIAKPPPCTRPCKLHTTHQTSLVLELAEPIEPPMDWRSRISATKPVNGAKVKAVSPSRMLAFTFPPGQKCGPLPCKTNPRKPKLKVPAPLVKFVKSCFPSPLLQLRTSIASQRWISKLCRPEIPPWRQQTEQSSGASLASWWCRLRSWPYLRLFAFSDSFDYSILTWLASQGFRSVPWKRWRGAVCWTKSFNPTDPPPLPESCVFCVSVTMGNVLGSMWRS